MRRFHCHYCGTPVNQGDVLCASCQAAEDALHKCPGCGEVVCECTPLSESDWREQAGCCCGSYTCDGTCDAEQWETEYLTEEEAIEEDRAWDNAMKTLANARRKREAAVTPEEREAETQRMEDDIPF